MTAQVILNPYSGRWKARRAIPEVERACAEVGLNYEPVLTEGRDHAIALARKAALAGRHPIIVAGGDGTIGEVVNGMMQASGGTPQYIPLGIIPLGSANDFADELRLPKDITAACRVIVAGHERLLDVGRVNGRYFVNNSAIGLEPMVTLTQQKMQRIQGTPRYVLATLRTILAHRPWQMRLEWDDGEYVGAATLVSVGNTRRTGGAFYMTPRALPDDGRLDFVFATGLGRLKLLRLLPATFNGSYILQPGIRYGRTTRLTITCDPPTPIHADGELFELAATRIAYDILPARLPVLVPR